MHMLSPELLDLYGKQLFELTKDPSFTKRMEWDFRKRFDLEHGITKPKRYKHPKFESEEELRAWRREQSHRYYLSHADRYRAEARAREYKKYWADGHERCFEWDKILDQFLASGKKLARVEVLGKSAYYVRQQLNRRIAKRGLGAKSCTGCGVVYLQGN